MMKYVFIMFELISGFSPFRNASACLTRPVKFEGKRWREASEEAKHLCACLLKTKPKDRIKARDAMKHPWFTKFGLGYYRDAINKDIDIASLDYSPQIGFVDSQSRQLQMS